MILALLRLPSLRVGQSCENPEIKPGEGIQALPQFSEDAFGLPGGDNAKSSASFAVHSNVTPGVAIGSMEGADTQTFREAEQWPWFVFTGVKARLSV
jgi:hypothetical protein